VPHVNNEGWAVADDAAALDAAANRTECVRQLVLPHTSPVAAVATVGNASPCCQV
jgi:hypothetical protein